MFLLRVPLRFADVEEHQSSCLRRSTCREVGGVDGFGLLKLRNIFRSAGQCPSPRASGIKRDPAHGEHSAAFISFSEQLCLGEARVARGVGQSVSHLEYSLTERIEGSIGRVFHESGL